LSPTLLPRHAALPQMRHDFHDSCRLRRRALRGSVALIVYDYFFMILAICRGVEPSPPRDAAASSRYASRRRCRVCRRHFQVPRRAC